MISAHHMKAFQHHQNTSLLNESSAIVIRTSPKAALQQIQGHLDIDQNSNDSNGDALGMLGHENQDCGDNKSHPRPSFCVQPIPESVDLLLFWQTEILSDSIKMIA